MSTLQQSVKALYAANGGNAAFPWSVILDIIKGIIGNCTTNAAAQRWASRHPEATKDALEAKYKEKKLFKVAADRDAAVQATYEGFVNATRAQLREMD